MAEIVRAEVDKQMEAAIDISGFFETLIYFKQVFGAKGATVRLSKLPSMAVTLKKNANGGVVVERLI